MGKRLFDLCCAALGLILAAPVLAIAALGIRLVSPGPILYRARRAGIGGRPFVMYKLRTMHLEQGPAPSRITAADDPRVFPLGRWLRRSKIDELPQLLNVLRGDMSIIGPRPEDPVLVACHYAAPHWETLTVRPGLSSPGTLYYETANAPLRLTARPESYYAERLLPLKLALDLVYVRRASLGYDFALVLRTLGVLLGRLMGRRQFPDPPELPLARRYMAPARSTRSLRIRAGLARQSVPDSLPPAARLAGESS